MRRTAIPQASDASAFGADCLLLGGFVIACGLPLYYVIGTPRSVLLGTLYMASMVVLVALLPFAIWQLHWGLPVPLRVRRIAVTSLLYQAPILIVAAGAVALQMEHMLLGVSIMAYSAAVLIALAGERFHDYPAPMRLIAVRLMAVVLTPVIVLGLTQLMPDGLSLVAAWAIPVPVAAAGAVGATRGFRHQMLLRDRLSSHS